MNLYVHFPFCRSKCTYCALHSRAGATPDARRSCCARLAADLARLDRPPATVYFGGGSPALCDLRPVFERLSPQLAPGAEFTVELHPLDAVQETLAMLRAGGVNRISMGVQSLDDGVLAAMNRLHTAEQAETAFRAVRAAGFENAGVDLIAGWPGTTPDSWRRTLDRVCALGPVHASVYTLIREPKTVLDLAVRKGTLVLPSDEEALAQIDAARVALDSIGLERYEISNYARPGRECRHNLAVWRGEDYLGLGEGAHGRIGRNRTENGAVVSTLAPEEDALERALFSLRTREGLDLSRVARLWPVLAPRLPAWEETLAFYKKRGLLKDAYRLTSRGAEVCDSILAELL